MNTDSLEPTVEFFPDKKFSILFVTFLFNQTQQNKIKIPEPLNSKIYEQHFSFSVSRYMLDYNAAFVEMIKLYESR